MFDELEETVRHRLAELWDFSSGLKVFLEKRLTLIGATQEQTYRELTEGETDIDILGSSLEEFILGAHKTHEEILAAQGSNI